ncbi:hypothetical protein, partial [Rhizobium leguminosarum]|uniref:hypothetical protein n=1 Tax=Rhizobium leguminosarum TaxID=384 RepID=UPI003F97A91B
MIKAIKAGGGLKRLQEQQSDGEAKKVKLQQDKNRGGVMKSKAGAGKDFIKLDSGDPFAATSFEEEIF